MKTGTLIVQGKSLRIRYEGNNATFAVRECLFEQPPESLLDAARFGATGCSYTLPIP